MDSGNNSSSLQSSGGGGGCDEEFDSRTLFPTTNISNASAACTNANSNRNNGFSCISNTTSSSSSSNFPFLDNFSFLVPASPFPLLDPRGPAVNPASKTPAPAPANSTLPSPRSSTTSSKKRSRASRRAPTTVLTTDTSNFRAMVQEFTGIPSPPFASSPSSPSSSSLYPPPRSRFDLFNPAFNASPSPSFLLKPYPQKQFHFPNTNATSATSSGISISGSSINYHHLPPPPPPPSSNFGLSNSQSLLQSPLAAKAQVMPSTSTAAADYGSAGYLGQLTGSIGSGWGHDAGVDPRNNLLRQVSNGACKLNYSGVGPAAEFGGDKGGEARGEGMVESWICSSD